MVPDSPFKIAANVGCSEPNLPFRNGCCVGYLALFVLESRIGSNGCKWKTGVARLEREW